MKIQVSCYAGYRGEQTPRRFWLGKNPVEILNIEDRWLAPDHRYFKVRGGDEAIYILRHDPYDHTWELVFFQHPSREKIASPTPGSGPDSPDHLRDNP